MSSNSDYQIGRDSDEEFTYRGHTLSELRDMELSEFAELLPARQRRSIERGLTTEQQKLFEKADTRDSEESANRPLRTHLRDMPILPQFVEKTFEVYDGQNFERVYVQPEMLGHYLGEFVLTRRSVEHGQAGIGATRSSKFVPLK